MKSYIYILCLIFPTLFSISCSEDFLKTKDPIYLDPIFLDKQEGSITEQIVIPGVNNSSFKLIQYPGWMMPESLFGNIDNGILEFSFRSQSNEINQLGGTVAFEIEERVFYVTIQIINSIFDISPRSLNFGTKETENSLSLQNLGEGNIRWEILHKPDWIELQPKLEGNLDRHVILQVKCNRSFPIGNYKDSIVVQANKQRVPVVVEMTILALENPENVSPIEGTVVDCRYVKEAGKLYILTKQPNALLIHTPNTGTTDKIPLPKGPSCMTFSEDNSLMFIGYSGQLSMLDLKNNRIVKNIELDFNVFSIAYGENRICYLTTQTGYFRGYYSLHLDNEKLEEHIDSNIEGYTWIIKVKGKAALLGSRTWTSPNGVIWVDISREEPEEKYWHESLGNRFWLTDDAELTIGSYGVVLKTPTKNTGSTLHPLGQLRFDNYNPQINWVDHDSKKNILWVAEGSVYFNETSGRIAAFSSDDYHLIRQFNSSDYVTVINGEKDFYPTQPYYVFSNKEGTELYSIRNIIDYNTPINDWSMEIIAVN